MYKKLGIEIRKKRKALHLTTKEVADFLGIKRNSYLNIECGQRKPTDNQLWKISSFLGCDLSNLYSLLNEIDGKQYTEDFVKNLIINMKEKELQDSEESKDHIIKAIKLKANTLKDVEIQEISELVINIIETRIKQIQREV